MRAILALAVALTALGWLAAEWDTGVPPPRRPQMDWRRTSQGWEPLAVGAPRAPQHSGEPFHPVSVAALQVLAIVLLVAADERRAQKNLVETRTDSRDAGH